jgi:hypothetical protein
MNKRRTVMTRIPSHSVEDAPEASRALLREMIQFSPTGRPLNVAALRAGKDVGDARTGALTSLVREAAANHGRVSDQAWDRAVASGWSSEQVAEAFAYLGLAVYTSYFLNYAATELDVPDGGSR